MGKRIYYSLKFKNPDDRIGPETLMEKLTALKAVEEVMVVDSRDGYTAKVRFFTGEEPEDVKNYLSYHIDARFGKLIMQ
jgi:hypothetical protein